MSLSSVTSAFLINHTSHSVATVIHRTICDLLHLTAHSFFDLLKQFRIIHRLLIRHTVDDCPIGVFIPLCVLSSRIQVYVFWKANTMTHKRSRFDTCYI